MSEAARLITAEELERSPEIDGKSELVAGRLVRMSPVGYEHGRVVVRLAGLLDWHARAHRLGVVLTEVGFTLSSDPDTVRAPDLAFLRHDRIPTAKPRGFWRGAPDLAIEVLSPDDRPVEIEQKVQEYLRAGTTLVLVVDTDRREVTMHRAHTLPSKLTEGTTVDLGDVLPDCQLRLDDMFD